MSLTKYEREARKHQNKQWMLEHISASSPCSFKSVLDYCRNQGLMLGFIQNFDSLKAEGLIYVSEGEENTIIVELA